MGRSRSPGRHRPVRDREWPFPSTLFFGHWKGEGYRERLEWKAFAHFLSDLAMLRKLLAGRPLDVGRVAELTARPSASATRSPRPCAKGEIQLPEEVAGPMNLNRASVPLLFFASPVQSGGGGFGGGGFGGGGFGGGGGLAAAAQGRRRPPSTPEPTRHLFRFSFSFPVVRNRKKRSITAANDSGI